MISLLSIDPGKKSVGWASFQIDELVDCGLIRGDSFLNLRYHVSATFKFFDPQRIVIEVPQIYEQRKWKGDPNDCIDVALVAGMCGTEIGRRIGTCMDFIRSHDWKGSRPKKICNKLTLKTLSPEETALYKAIKCPPSLRHNVLDAIGVGLWNLRRR